ncbi:hypothetical protein ACFV1W_37025 [Kitasatospora sp. NPDC059648]|uniref:hypothetical protein n=1 Tax=Kitasatospora sp. NPDC059648 TaxID=3346894 RepID=UPI0036747863
MPINDALPQPPRGSMPPCPGCALTDQVRAVPAVHMAERRNVTVHSSDRDGRTQTRTQEEVSALGRALAPAPPATSTAFKALVILSFPALAGAVVTFTEGIHQRNAAADSGPDLSPPAWVTKQPGFPNDLPGFPKAPPSSPLAHTAAPLADVNGTPTVLLVSYLLIGAVIALLAGATALFLARRRRLAGRPRAERLWNQAWYCARCATAHFPPAAGQGTGALTLTDFRRTVWTAGGYGDLADRYHP